MTIERLERAWEMLIDVTEGQLMPFGNGRYEEITKVYGEQIKDVKNLIRAEIERLSVENTQGELLTNCNQWEDLLDFVYYNARESYQEMSNLIFMYLDAKGVNYTEPLENIEQLPCEWCSEYSGDISAEKWLSCEEDGYTHHYLSQQPVNYCPNCGQAIDWGEE